MDKAYHAQAAEMEARQKLEEHRFWQQDWAHRQIAQEVEEAMKRYPPPQIRSLIRNDRPPPRPIGNVVDYNPFA